MRQLTHVRIRLVGGKLYAPRSPSALFLAVDERRGPEGHVLVHSLML